MIFSDRLDAGAKLAMQLKKFKNDAGIVLAVPRGGVPVAYAVARELDFPLELVLTKKIGHPLNPEYAIGAATTNDYFIIPHDDVPEQYVSRKIEEIQHKLKEMYKKFMGDEAPPDLKGKTVIVIDDGIATGNTLMAAIRILRKSEPARIIVAVPVAAAQAVEMLQAYVDELVVILVPSKFHGVGAYYENFEQVDDNEVLYYLDKMRDLRKAG